MKKYKFLFKPLFFIFSLLFTSWMVLTIEKLQPSDFGRYNSLFKTKPDTGSASSSSQKSFIREAERYDKQWLKKLCLDYECGLIDSTKLDQQLELFLKNAKN